MEFLHGMVRYQEQKRGEGACFHWHPTDTLGLLLSVALKHGMLRIVPLIGFLDFLVGEQNGQDKNHKVLNANVGLTVVLVSGRDKVEVCVDLVVVAVLV